MGISIDSAANETNSSVISTKESRILVLVEPTNEEWIAASRANEMI